MTRNSLSGPSTAADTPDRRRHTRARLALPGRYMTPDGGEYHCLTVDVSPGGIRLKAPRICAPGAQIIAYIDDLGRVEGVVVRTLCDGFALAFACTPRKAQRLLNSIEWLLFREAGGVQRRNSPRTTREGAIVVLIEEDGGERVVELTDFSSSGFAFLSEQPMQPGVRLELGTQRACVTRTFPGGAVALFD